MQKQGKNELFEIMELLCFNNYAKVIVKRFFSQSFKSMFSYVRVKKTAFTKSLDNKGILET